jgi:pimeloyl-ACP methyl ester carboxylesterase
MHLVCKGERSAESPAVILQSGAAAESLYWYWVQNQLAEYTQVCAYDRPGHGWSDSVDGPRDPLTIDAELHTLLEQAGVAAPYVMAGHSFGAAWTRVYAAQYSEQIAGIVLVDTAPMPEPFASQSEYDAWKAPQNVIQTILWGAYRTGVTRLLAPGLFQSAGYPPEIVPEMAALQARNQVFDADYAEVVHGMSTFADASADAAHLGDLPMLVLWAGNGPMAGDLRAALRDEIAGFSDNSLTRNVEGADHGSILGNEASARQVSDAILDVIAASQTGEPLPASP